MTEDDFVQLLLIVGPPLPNDFHTVNWIIEHWAWQGHVLHVMQKMHPKPAKAAGEWGPFSTHTEDLIRFEQWCREQRRAGDES